MARSPASAPRARSGSTCASSPRPTRTCRGWPSEGRFRADLLDRLSFEVITLPPLRVREGDIDVLADYFGRRMAAEIGWERWPGFADARRARSSTSIAWPGNVRELRNVVERAVYRWDDWERADRPRPVRPVRQPVEARAMPRARQRRRRRTPGAAPRPARAGLRDGRRPARRGRGARARDPRAPPRPQPLEPAPDRQGAGPELRPAAPLHAEARADGTGGE